MTCIDFLLVPPNPIYGFVLMNPPFSLQQDIAHVLHAYKFLKPGGTLTAIMATSFTFRTNKKSSAFRAFLEERGAKLKKVGAGAFKSSGTMVDTVIVHFSKPLLELPDIDRTLGSLVHDPEPGPVVTMGVGSPDHALPKKQIFVPENQIGFDF